MNLMPKPRQADEEAPGDADPKADFALDDDDGEFSSEPMPAALSAVLFLLVGLGLVAWIVVSILR